MKFNIFNILFCGYVLSGTGATSDSAMGTTPVEPKEQAEAWDGGYGGYYGHHHHHHGHYHHGYDRSTYGLW